MREFYATAVAVGLLLFSATGSTTEAEPIHLTSICAIRTNQNDFMGKLVKLHVHYTSVQSYVAFVSNQAAGGPECVMNIQSVTLMNAPSVKYFLKEGDDICQRRREFLGCSLNAELDVLAIIRVEANGRPFADFQKVLGFKYFQANSH